MNFYTARQLDYLTPREAKSLGFQFAQWLNITGGTKLVLRLLDLEQRIRHLNAELTQHIFALPVGPDGEDGSDDVTDEMGERLDHLVNEFDRLMSRCKVYPHLINIEFSEGEYEFRWDLVGPVRKALKRERGLPQNSGLDDLDALLCIVRLGQFGYLSRMKRCHCNQWYFARQTYQEFCSHRCRQRVFSKSEKFKAHRRKYMRKYYKLKVSGLVK